jgi:hypothetical protein
LRFIFRHCSVLLCTPHSSRFARLASGAFYCAASLARIMHEPPAATADMAVLPGVLGSRTLRRTDKYASGPSPCGYPVARPSPRSRHGVSCIMRAGRLCTKSPSFTCASRPYWARAQVPFFTTTISKASLVSPQ